MTFFLSTEAPNRERQAAEPFDTKWASFCAALTRPSSTHRRVLLDCRTVLSHSDVLSPCPFPSWEEVASVSAQLLGQNLFKHSLNPLPIPSRTDSGGATVMLKQEFVKWCLNMVSGKKKKKILNMFFYCLGKLFTLFLKSLWKNRIVVQN